MGAVSSLREFSLRILEEGGLELKLEAPSEGLVDLQPGPPLVVEHPARAPGLEFAEKVQSLPRPGELVASDARARCLARFAHHELMAVELFAWALLAWPELPASVRRGLIGLLADEQRHCRMYLERLSAHGSALHEHELSDYFWQHTAAIAAAPNPPLAFFAAVGLTLEQANLDFSLLYRDAFRSAGDEESARVCERIHEDEIGHVRQAAIWLRELAPPHQDEVTAYREAVPFPLSAARAKGRSFVVEARRRAGLSEDFIAFVRDARSSQEARPRRGSRS